MEENNYLHTQNDEQEPTAVLTATPKVDKSSMYEKAVAMYNAKLLRAESFRATHKAKVKKANRAKNKVARKSRKVNRG